jgi:SWI/SNF-related matrix-associated actin-dependent regulator of chromatin subfamily B protein 1
LYIVGRPSTGPADILDEELRSAFLSPVKSVARSSDDVPNFMPVINYLSDSEIERTEREREKEIQRRKKRAARNRRGVTLPDREPLPTQRTPAIGFPELNPAALAAANLVAAPTSRRAAAAAAATTIANMVASENGETTPSRPITTAPQPEKPQKEKKSKGHFKAPPLPPGILRPRASVVAPTPSTAAGASTVEPAPVEPPEQPKISAKRAKELERENKEKEYAETQHENMIDGVWHCSNCGCPDAIAIGRRKGPLGDKSQCGTCGKFWHRYRRPMPVEYNTSAEWHLNKGKEPEATKKGRNVKRGGEKEAPTEPSTPAPPDRVPSPATSDSSGEEAPLAQRVKANGAGTRSSDRTKEPSPPPAAEAEPPTTSQPVVNGIPAPPPTPKAVPVPPPWLVAAKQEMLLKYPNDRFDYCQRRVGNAMEWRLRCTDCPGKVRRFAVLSMHMLIVFSDVHPGSR